MTTVKMSAYLVVMLVAARCFPAVAQDLSGNDPHWMKAEGQDCWVRNPSPKDHQSITWSGGCKNRLANGHGAVDFTNPDEGIEIITTGNMIDGSFRGRVTQDIISPGNVHVYRETDFANGLPNGYGYYRAERNGIKTLEYTGQFVDGRMSGQGHGIYYNPATGQPERDFNGIWAEGKPSVANTIPSTSGSSAGGSSSSIPVQAQAPTSTPTPQSQSASQDDAQRQADIQEAKSYWWTAASDHITGSQYMPAFKQMRDDPNATGWMAKWEISSYFERKYAFSKDVSPENLLAAYQRKLYWDQELLTLITQNPSVAPSFASVSRTKYDIAQDKSNISKYQTQIQEAQEKAAADKREQAQQAAEDAAFRKKLPSLLAERKDIGDKVCLLNGYVGYVENVHGNKIEVKTREGVTRGGVMLNQWENKDWIDYNKTYKCE
ncbi:MORN repeat-containing protein [Paraburkholderia tropica]|uniref:hypothetical protein n=1 Tax=Paraburkholderia tropica TaxID=92647 RepID=UPI002AB628AA|nr:hypothetical protein [Paraburkholderia tropica]